MPEQDKNKLRGFLKLTISLLNAMEAALNAEDSENIWKHSGYKQYARKYNQIVDLISKETELPQIIDYFDLKKIPSGGDTLPFQRKEFFDSVHANLSLLRAFLETEIGVVDDEILVLRDFLQSRMRSAIIRVPDKERDVQDVVEQLFIGRGMQKGQDYDREAGRVKISSKESVPDFIIPKLSLAIEVKFVKIATRVAGIIDEVSADITRSGQ